MPGFPPLSPAEAVTFKEMNLRKEEYPKQVWYLILSALAFATLLNLFSIASKWLRLRRGVVYRDATGEIQPLSRRDTVSLRRLPSAFLTALRIVAFRWAIPTGRGYSVSVLDAFITVAYTTALLVWEFVNTDDLSMKYWTSRSGHIAAAQFVLLPALASKNNVIGWLTGIGHEKLNYFHRAAARSIFILICVHFFGEWKFSHLASMAFVQWQQFGAAAGLAFVLILVLSVRPIRAFAYESFYWTHLVLVNVFFLMAYLHTSGVKCNYYIWPVWVVWGFDRVLRALRYIVNNFVLRRKVKGTVEFLSPHSIRLTIPNTRMSWVPGQHAFLAMPGISGFPLESHPFSIASIPSEGSKDNELLFIIRGRSGFTKRLREHVMIEGTREVTVFVDGPYGAPPNATPDSTCVLIAGGSGVTCTLPLFLDTIRKVNAGKAVTRRLLFVWAVQREDHVDWISPQLVEALASAPQGLNVDIHVYVTGAQPEMKDTTSDSIGSSTNVSHMTQKELSGLRLRQGRPDVRQILEEEIAASSGPLSVSVSGPKPLISSVRTALSSHMAGPTAVLKGAPTVDLHTEYYSL